MKETIKWPGFRFPSLVLVLVLALANQLTGADPANAVLADTAVSDGKSGLIADSSLIEPRLPAGESLQSLQSQKDFAYLKASPKDDSWWSRFWMWLRQLLGRMANEGEGMGFWEIILTRVLPGALALAALVLVILKLLGMNPDAVLRKKTVSLAVPFQEAGETGSPDDFDAVLEDALRRQDFRLAIRLHYLDILRHLSRAELISWHPDKTNRHYFRELSDQKLKEPFGRLTRIFEYVWYGEATPGEREFEAAKSEFLALKNSIKSTSR